MRKLIEYIKMIAPYYNVYKRMGDGGIRIKYWNILLHKLGLFNRQMYWFRPKSCWVGMPKRIYIGKNCNVGRNNNYFQAFGGIYIGDCVRFASKVNLLTSNHDIYNHSISHHKPIVIGDYCWLGMNTSILPGVELGPRTIVATGAVVNKSFPEGYCIIAGVPAKKVKELDPSLFHKEDYELKEPFYGYLSGTEMEKNPQKILDKYLDKDFFEINDGKIVLKKK